jgi:Ger(x)C family germination protein
MIRKIWLISLIICFLFFSSGCWDKKEIEEQAFVIGLALDKGNKQDNNIIVTFQIALPQAFVAEAQSDEPFWNISMEAANITEAEYQLTKEMNQIPNLEHCQVILIGEELAREGLNEYLDFLIRTHEVRRMINIGIVQGKAKDVLNIDFKTALIPSFVISEMMSDNSKRNLELTNFMNIGKLHMADTLGYDFILARVIALNDKLDMSGGSVFRGMKMVGWLSGEEIKGIRFLRGDVGSGSLDIELPEEIGKRAMLRIFEAQSILEPEIRDGRLIAKLKLRIEGDITEIISDNENLGETELLKRIQKLFENDIKKKVEKSFKKVQQEYGCDPFMLKEKTKSYYPEFWRQNNEILDEIYRSAKLEIEARVLVRRIGEIRH